MLREVSGRDVHWVFDGVGPDGPLAPRSQIVIGDDAWDRGLDGTWSELVARPLRTPLLVWVNGHVNGPDVLESLPQVGTDAIEGVGVSVHAAGLEEMMAAFPRRFADRDLAAGSFRYWVTECGEIMQAEVSIELGGSDRRDAEAADFPFAFSYAYQVYDVGADVDIAAPNDGHLPAIPGP